VEIVEVSEQRIRRALHRQELERAMRELDAAYSLVRLVQKGDLACIDIADVRGARSRPAGQKTSDYSLRRSAASGEPGRDAAHPESRNWRALLVLDGRRLKECIGPRDALGDDVLVLDISKLGLSTRTFRCLEGEGIRTIRELLQMSPARLMRIPRFGITSLANVVERLKQAIGRARHEPETERAPDTIPHRSSEVPDESLRVNSLAYQSGYGSEWLSRADRIPVEALGLTVRAYNCVRKKGVRSVGQLGRWSGEELMSIRNMGRKSLADIKAKLPDLDIDRIPTLENQVSAPVVLPAYAPSSRIQQLYSTGDYAGALDCIQRTLESASLSLQERMKLKILADACAQKIASQAGT